MNLRKARKPEETAGSRPTLAGNRLAPYVEDRRNTLIFEPLQTQSREVITSLAFALKNAIQISYQLEDGELAAELLARARRVPIRDLLRTTERASFIYGAKLAVDGGRTAI